MSQLAVERVLGRLVTDAEFRNEFFVEPMGICQNHGLDLTPVELAALLRLDERALQTLADRLDPKIVRAMRLQGGQGADTLDLPQPPRDRRPQRRTSEGRSRA